MHTARPHLAVSQRKACHYFVSESCFRPAANKSLISLHHVESNSIIILPQQLARLPQLEAALST